MNILKETFGNFAMVLPLIFQKPSTFYDIITTSQGGTQHVEGTCICHPRGLVVGPKILLTRVPKGAVIFNAGDRGGRIFRTNRNFFLPHLLNVISFATPFQGRKKFHTPLLSDLS